MRLTSPILALALALIAAPDPAAALSSEGQLGSKGVLVPGGVVSFQASHFSPPGAGDGSTAFTLIVAPELLFFISDNVAVGGAVSASVFKASDVDAATGVGLAPAAAYNVVMGAASSMLLKGKLDLRRSSGITSMTLSAEAPLLYHVGNYFIGGGPFVAVDLFTRTSGQAAGRTFILGIMTELGGWFRVGGEEALLPADRDPHQPERAPPNRPEPDLAPPPADPTGDDWDV